MTPRGIRNNNPLNIRRTNDVWIGQSAAQTDAEFVRFSTMAWGIRAACVIINTFVIKYGCRTVEDILKKWAPASENQTTLYINCVCRLSGLEAGDEVKVKDVWFMTHLFRGMIWAENGREINRAWVKEGIDLWLSFDCLNS